MLIEALLLAAVTATATPAAPADLVGSYYQGDGTGTNLTLDLRADGSFSFVWTGCLGTYDQKSGRWSVIDGVIYLDVHEEAADGMPDSLAATYRPVSWGVRTYLVPSDEMQDFANEVNEGGEPRREAQGQTYLREGDWETPVSGAPAVPASARPYLLAQPVRATVTAQTGPTSARISAGSNAGLLPGMVLYDQANDSYVAFRVVSVSDTTSEVETLNDEPAPASASVSSLLWDDALRPRPPAPGQTPDEP